MVSSEVEDLLPILKTCSIEHSERDSMRVISPNGKTMTVHLKNHKLLGFSRLKFDQCLLDLAVNEGANLIKEKVTGLEHKQGWWKVRAQKQSYEVKTLVGADGVNSLVRRNTIGPLSKRDKGACFGYLVRGLERKDITIKFLPTGRGYLWVVPRAENTSVGGGTAESDRFHEIRREVNAFASEFFPQAEIISKWTAVIPNIKDAKTLRIPVAGSDWILVGDAAGHVDPISGSGIIYALIDGEKAADAIVEGTPETFNRLWVEAYGQSLFLATKLRGWIYKRPLLELYCMYMKTHSIMPLP
jgi:digeranylgeranylglycerophospholipid reductase